MNMYQPFPSVDFEREIQKRISKRLQRLDQGQREIFEKLVVRVFRHLDFDSMAEDVLFKYRRDIRDGKRPNLDFFYENVNKVIRKAENRIRRKRASNWSEGELEEFTYQLIQASRSICRYFDPMARCWKSINEKLLQILRK